jgi:hypothetical protein
MNTREESGTKVCNLGPLSCVIIGGK